jgi:23S rRNA (adenine2503-C2)-methyltransferase
MSNTLPTVRPTDLHPVSRLPEEWLQYVREQGERSFHGKQIFRWIHARRVFDPHGMTDLSVALRTKLLEQGTGLEVCTSKIHISADGTRKLLVAMKDGSSVESVLLHQGEINDADGAAADVDSDDEDQEPIPEPTLNLTQCISSQVGCAMGCTFCASGVAGLKRHLKSHEIVGQVLLAQANMKANERLRNVVFMGMGEPLHNYNEVARALRLLTHPDGIALAKRRVTVSTSGLIPEIERLGQDFEGQISLAISLHAGDNETRSRIMPINKKYPLEKLIAALESYPLPKRRKITIEYTLVSGKNDSVEDARKVAGLLQRIPVKINLIPMNRIDASSMGPSAWERVEQFQETLKGSGYLCFIRKRRGDDVAAACGQLALHGEKAKVRVNRD